MSDLSPRASDADRERAVLALREHLAVGRLTLEEFSARMEQAYEARTAEDLAAVGESLPDVREPSRRRHTARVVGALFAHVVRRGRVRLARFALVLSGFSDVDLDLREAQLAHKSAAIVVVALFGNVDVYVPEGIGVDLVGLNVGGHRRDWGRESALADAPFLRVFVAGLFGTVDLWRVPSDVKGSYREVIKALRAAQRELPG